MKLNGIVSISSLVFLLPYQTFLYALPDPNISEFFSEFDTHPSKVMNRIPQKYLEDGTSFNTSMFNDEQIESKEFLLEKDEGRVNLIKKQEASSVTTKAEYLSHDNFRSLLDDFNQFIDKLDEIDTKNLSSANVSVQPWSGSYWPSYLGGAANRYSDRYFVSLNNFNQIYSYLTYQRPASILISENRVQDLSPTEKYDLLMNDNSYTLTRATLNQLMEKNSRSPIQSWEGICDGWAIGSYMYKRPVRTVTVSNVSGQNITFYPDDIKALTTLLWARLNKGTNLVGGRCNDRNPQTDMNGRLISQECFESNPATVHLALVNQVGINHKSFVFDSSYDYQVWNQPVYGYKYRYFNVQTREAFTYSADAKIPLNQYYYDKFRQYRSYKTKDIVGVELTLYYVVETAPDHSTTDSPATDRVVSVKYFYDLELDDSGRAIGGEWYQNAHPDFLWTVKSTRDVSLNALDLDSPKWAYNYKHFIWNDTPRSPDKEWTIYSRYYAQKTGTPLDHVVKSLAAWASENNSDEIPEHCSQPCIPNKYNWHQ